MQNHNDDTITMSRDSSLEKYTSRFNERVVRDRELETEQNCNILTPQPFWLLQPFFPVLLGCSTGGLGAQPLLGYGSHSSIFSQTDLNFLLPGLYNNLTPIYFLWASHLYSIQPIDSQGYPLIHWYLQLDETVIYTSAFYSFDSLAGSICNNHPIIIFQNFTCEIFLHVRLHSPHTHILQNNFPGQ